jgi:hypothetical protein
MVNPGDGIRADKNAIYNAAGYCCQANRPAAIPDKSTNCECGFGVCLEAIEEGCQPVPLLKLCPLFADTYGRCNRDRNVADFRVFARPTGTECAHK